MVNVFISYRRSDSGGWVNEIDGRLTKVLGREHVFRDIRSISPGADFEREIKHRILSCNVVLVVIGPLWLVAGEGRLEDPEDTVRREIELALQSQLVVVPVTVGDAPLPDFRRLRSRKLRSLAKLNAFRMSVKHFDRDLDDLVAELQRIPVADSSAEAPQAVSSQGVRSPLPADEQEHVDEPEELPNVGIVSSNEGDIVDRLDETVSLNDPLVEAIKRLDAIPPGGDPLGEQPLRIRITTVEGGWRFERAVIWGSSLNVPDADTANVGSSALDELLRHHRGDLSSLDRAQGELLFRILVPRTWRTVLASATGIQLQLDADADRLPWESVWVPNATLPLGFGAALMRDCIEPRYRSHSADAGDQALVLLGGAAPAIQFASLPGAVEEVQAISKTLAQAGFDVETLSEPDAFGAISAIALRNNRVIHLSGHSVMGWLPDTPYKQDTETGKRKPLSGLVIGDGVVLTEHELLLQDEIPELVTLGTDQLGSWGLILRSAGCRVVIAAHLPLDDRSASTFFKNFYAEIVGGASAGAAAMRARLQLALEPRSDAAVAALRLCFYGELRYRLLAAAKPN